MSIPEILIIIVCLPIALLPSIIAFQNKHSKKYLILILNIFVGITIIGPIILLIWSLSENNTYKKKR